MRTYDKSRTILLVLLMLGRLVFLSLHFLPVRVLSLGVAEIVFSFPALRRGSGGVGAARRTGVESDSFRWGSPLERGGGAGSRLGTVLVRATRRVVTTGEFTWGRERSELSMDFLRPMFRDRDVGLDCVGLWTGGSSINPSSSLGKVGEGAETTDIALSHRSTNFPRSWFSFTKRPIFSLRLGISNMDRGVEWSANWEANMEGSAMLERMLSIATSSSGSGGEACSGIVSWSDTMQSVRFMWYLRGS